ncbi:MAG TPA: SDR family NAD(P)-dependent oxidoreductase [Opitutaceae bacterium]|jgi:short-subunit dehydrogenase|nr:SDR family NAD(P)-dependent oxidoreductase [Opitutaceae bacterium]
MPLAERYRTAFVTGASSGLGRAFAAMLLADGVRVWGTSRDPKRLEGFGAGFTPCALDLAQGDAAEAAFARAEAEAGGFDLVVNNAGYGLFGEFAETEWKVWEAQLTAMLSTTLRLARAAYAGMRGRERGCLVNVSSLAAEFPLPFMAGYNVAKAGLSALSESLIFESRGSPVTILDFRPGDYRTAFNQAMLPLNSAPSARTARAWRVLDQMLRSAPPPERAAAHLRLALGRGRSGIVRSGSFFQAKVAPLAARVLPEAWKRAVQARYFGV